MSEITIKRLGHHGDGVADGPVFVPRVLPGEVVTGTFEKNRLLAPKIVTPSPARVAPSCRHYASCGGCALQHASDAVVANWKVDLVRSALQAHGISAPIADVHTSLPGTRRRASLSGRRTKKGALVGFHAPQSDVIAGIEMCQILHPDILALVPHLDVLTREIASRKGEVRFAVTATQTGLDLAVSGGKQLSLDLRSRLAVFCEIADLARLTWDDETIAERRPPMVEIGTALVPIPPGAFLQATKDGQVALQDAVLRSLCGARRVADLFAGCGTFALSIARQAEVHAVEGVADLLHALDAGWRHASGLKKVTPERRDLFRQPLTPQDVEGFDAVVLDPPRAGAELQTKMLADARVPTIASVSCNPVTFARDSAILTRAGYTLTRIDVVDQFRWSPHVELVGAFSLA